MVTKMSLSTKNNIQKIAPILLGLANGMVSTIGGLLFSLYFMFVSRHSMGREIFPPTSEKTAGLATNDSDVKEHNRHVDDETKDSIRFISCYGLQFLLILMAIFAFALSIVEQVKTLNRCKNPLVPTFCMGLVIYLTPMFMGKLMDKCYIEKEFRILMHGFGYITLVVSSYIFSQYFYEVWLQKQSKVVLKEISIYTPNNPVEEKLNLKEFLEATVESGIKERL